VQSTPTIDRHVPAPDSAHTSLKEPLVWLCAILALYVAHVVYLNCVAEDAYITLRFAKNLALGRGLVWNPGEAPVEGYTNFLWLLLSVGAMKIGLDAPRFTQIAGTLCGGATIVLTYAAGRRLAGWPRALAMVPPLMLAVSGPFATWSGSGMETVPFTSLVFAAVFAFATYWQVGQRRWLIGMSAALVGAALTRPEGVMVFFLLLSLSVALSAGQFRRRLIDHVAAAACWGIPFACYFAWRYSYFGFLLPNTFYAKTGGGLDQVQRGMLTSGQFVWQFVGPLVPWVCVVVWEVGVPRLGRVSLARVVDWLRRQALIVACFFVTAAYTLYIVAVGNDYMAMHRFFVPLLPLIYLVGSAPLALLVPRIAADRSRRPVVVALVSLAAATTLFHSTGYERYFIAKSTYQHGNYQGVQIARWHAARLTLLGRFFEGYRQSSEESPATNAIGVIGYLGNFKVYDFYGVVDVHIARLQIPPQKRDALTGHQKEDYPYVLGKKPTYIMFERELTQTPADIERFIPVGVWPLVRSDYVVRSVWLTDEVNHEAGYFSFLERGDHPRTDAEVRLTGSKVTQ